MGDDSRVVYHVGDFLTGNCNKFNSLRATELYNVLLILSCLLFISDVIGGNVNAGMCLLLNEVEIVSKAIMISTITTVFVKSIKSFQILNNIFCM